MAVISAHILDSVKGASAAGIRCQLLQLTPVEQKQVVFDVIADHEGRICETVQIDSDTLGSEFELVMHAADYFQTDSSAVPVVVIRFIIGDADKRYHMPVMLSPHSYSTWWSN